MKTLTMRDLETLRLVERVRTQRAARAMRSAARSTRKDGLGPAEIDSLIAKVRQEREPRRRA